MKKIISALTAVLMLLAVFSIGVFAQESPCDISVNYSGHIEDIGDTGAASNGDILGTVGQSKRMEALRVNLDGNRSDVNVEYQAHVEDIGWQNNVADGETAGTTGQSKRMEAIRIRLLGARADQYDVYYRTHVQGYGWLQWTSNGNPSGTQGYGMRLEALQVQVVAKGAAVTAAGPADDTAQSFMLAQPQVDTTVSLDMPIMGNSGTTAEQLVNFYNTSAGRSFPTYYQQRGVDLNQFAQMYVEECNAENVRVDVAFCQAMLETGFLGFGGDVSISQFNFAGLGATGGGVPGENFAAKFGDDANGIRMGIRAQIQHLKAYASLEPLNQACVDSRFNLVSRGRATTLNGLTGTWAVGAQYAQNILVFIRRLH